MMTGTVIGFRASSNKTTQTLLIRPAGRIRSSSLAIGTSASARVNCLISQERPDPVLYPPDPVREHVSYTTDCQSDIMKGKDLSSSMEKDFVFLGCDEFVARDGCPKGFTLGGETVSSLKDWCGLRWGEGRGGDIEKDKCRGLAFAKERMFSGTIYHCLTRETRRLRPYTN